MDSPGDSIDSRTASGDEASVTAGGRVQGDPGTAPPTDGDPRDRQLKACERALFYIGERMQDNPDVGYYLGYGTEIFHRIAVAIATLTDKPLDEVEKALREDRQPHYRRRQPEVIRLREKLDELREQFGV